MTKIDVLKCEVCQKVFIFQFGSFRRENWKKYHFNWNLMVISHIFKHQAISIRRFEEWIKAKE